MPVIAYNARLKASRSPSPGKGLYNPYEGSKEGRQLAESVDDFLQRLPPLTTPLATTPWIFVANPYASHRPTDGDLAGFRQGAGGLLENFSETKNDIETSMAGKAKSSITRKLTPLRKKLEEALMGLAKEKHYTTGKWMLFPLPEDVNRCWAIVAEATINRELGIAAKVATDDGRGNMVSRLICVYTKDFSDMDDVKRVLDRLLKLGLVMKKGPAGEERGIYYKTDAFTELGIMSENEWGLKASLYASKDVLKTGKK